MPKKLLLLTTLILSNSLSSDTTRLKNGKVYHNVEVFHKGDTVTVSFECGKRIVFKQSEISETIPKPLTRWKTQEECNQTEEEAKQAAEKRKEEKRLQEEQRRQELALKKQECEANGNVWNGKDCRLHYAADYGKWSEYQGAMDWYRAKNLCKILDMRLPTRKELLVVRKAGIWKKWQEENNNRSSNYWTSEESSRQYAYYVSMGNGISLDEKKVFSTYCVVRCIHR